MMLSSSAVDRAVAGPSPWLAIAQREDERLAEQSLSGFQRLPVIFLTGHAGSARILIKAMSPMLAHCRNDGASLLAGPCGSIGKLLDWAYDPAVAAPGQ
jgi:hypothetical protein